MPKKGEYLDARQSLWSKIDRRSENECWNWKAARTHDGYGRFHLPGFGHTMAHRAVWMLTVGPIPEGQQVCHNCPEGDNRACCNPAHLWLGTIQENLRDRDQKGRTARGDRSGPRLYPERYPRGEKNGNAKLSDEAADSIRQRMDSGESPLNLAEEYGISFATAYRIRAREIRKPKI